MLLEVSGSLSNALMWMLGALVLCPMSIDASDPHHSANHGIVISFPQRKWGRGGAEGEGKGGGDGEERAFPKKTSKTFL